MALATGTRLGPYEIQALVGAGGMGEVYKARDSRLDRDVAIKVLPERFSQDANALGRFHRELKAVAALSHPNILTIFDTGSEGGVSYAVTELLEGQTLGSRLKRSTLDWRTAVQIALEIAEGLHAAHSRGIIHRDIKPENIYLTARGGVKILDFGLARLKTKEFLSSDVTELLGPGSIPATVLPETEPGVILGTVVYMSPEQVRGQQADARSDIFSFGCVLFEMVTGRRPFERATSADTMVAILHDPPPALSESGKERPVELDRLIAGCLAKEPAQRFASAADVLAALRALQSVSALTDTDKTKGLDTVPVPPPPTRRPEVSVAVLPFVNMSADKENEYFSDGLAEELINVLSKVEDLQVASRTSSFAFKGKSEDVRKIGEQLNVGTVLEGSVRKSGNRLRISAQLVKVKDGYQLWSETYNRTMEDVFEIQDEIAQSIAKALKVILTEKDKQAMEQKQTADVQAYDYYLRGLKFFHQFRRKSLEFALQMFAKAIEIDPNYSRAYAGLADCHSLIYTNWDRNPEFLSKADAASQRALDLAPDLAEAHVARGMALMYRKEYELARKHFHTALGLNPNLFEAHFLFARTCMDQGKLEEAAKHFENASKICPEDYQAAIVGAGVFTGLGRKAEAEAAYRRGLAAAERHLQLHPDDARAYYLGASSWTQLGQPEKALLWAKRAREIDPDEPLTLYNIACIYALQNKVDEAIDILEQAVAKGYKNKNWMAHDADFNSLRGHARFVALVDSMDGNGGKAAT